MTNATEVPPDTFPRQYARTRRFSLGEPRGIRIAPDGERIAFLRSNGGSDPVTRLMVLDRSPSGRWTERLVADPLALFRSGESDLPGAERARRERLRESAEGITAFDVDRDVRFATFVLAGVVHVADLLDGSDGSVRALSSVPGAFDPRLSPDGRHVAYVSDRCLHVITTEDLATNGLTTDGLTTNGLSTDGTSNDRLVIGEDDADVSWGLPDFIAAEELDRYRGFWWSPDSASIFAVRVDESPVQRWYIADPAHPSREPVIHRYPVAGSANARLRAAVFSVATLARTDVSWEADAFPYLVDVQWTDHGLLSVHMNRAQTRQRISRIDPTSGGLTTIRDVDDRVWVERTPGTPLLRSDGSVLIAIDTRVSEDHDSEPEGTRALVLLDPGTLPPRVLTRANLHVRRLICADESHAVVAVTASRKIEGLDVPADTGAVNIVRVALSDGTTEVVAGGLGDVGTHDVVTANSTRSVSVRRSTSVGRTLAEFSVFEGPDRVAELHNRAEVALVDPRPHFFRAGRLGVPCAVFLPSGSTSAATGQLPVLLDPYGGPHAQRVVASRNAHATSQWFADQGFVVVVVDGRGTPGLGPAFERAVHLDLAGPVLDDQITGLQEAATRFPQMDLTRVGIRGWSFGGYLAALAVLRRPDVFHAAVAGAPVTDWRLYDTAYTERYLGNPTEDTSAYDRCSLLPLAPNLTRPLMLIHGLADDNVVAAHTLQLSSALLAAGRPHEVLPLSGVTHMTPQEVVAENLLMLQVDFLRRSLG